MKSRPCAARAKTPATYSLDHPVGIRLFEDGLGARPHGDGASSGRAAGVLVVVLQLIVGVAGLRSGGTQVQGGLVQTVVGRGFPLPSQVGFAIVIDGLSQTRRRERPQAG